MQEAMHFIGAELHKACAPLFNPAITEEQKAYQHKSIHQKLAWVEARLADGRGYLTGEAFTLADDPAKGRALCSPPASQMNAT